jgi:hypothetical protein
VQTWKGLGLGAATLLAASAGESISTNSKALQEKERGMDGWRERGVIQNKGVRRGRKLRPFGGERGGDVHV